MRGSVKKDGKSWYYVVDVGINGKRKQKKQRNFKTKKEAEKALAEINYELNKGTYIEPSNTLYKEYVDQWF